MQAVADKLGVDRKALNYYGSDVVAATRTSENPFALRLQQALNNARGQPLKHIESITDSAVRTYNREQLELSIEIFIRGTEALVQNVYRKSKGQQEYNCERDQ